MVRGEALTSSAVTEVRQQAASSGPQTRGPPEPVRLGAEETERVRTRVRLMVQIASRVCARACA